MENGRATININIDVEIDNTKFDDVISEIITKIHGGKLCGEGFINGALFNYEVNKSYVNNFRVEQLENGKKRIIFQSKINKKDESI